jgi:hypothetical protein
VLFGEIVWTHYLADHLHVDIMKMSSIIKQYNRATERLNMLDYSANSSRPYFVIRYEDHMGLGNQMFLYASSYDTGRGHTGRNYFRLIDSSYLKKLQKLKILRNFYTN